MQRTHLSTGHNDEDDPHVLSTPLNAPCAGFKGNATTTEERALYTIHGQIEIAGDIFGPGQLLVLRPGDEIVVKALPDGTGDHARFMLFGGAPMEGPRYIWWNFVSSRPERIEQAKEEWARGQFETVPGDEEEFIPLPDEKRGVMRAEGGVHYP